MPHVAIGSYPVFDPALDYRVKVTVEAAERGAGGGGRGAHPRAGCPRMRVAPPRSRRSVTATGPAAGAAGRSRPTARSRAGSAGPRARAAPGARARCPPARVATVRVLAQHQAEAHRRRRRTAAGPRGPPSSASASSDGSQVHLRPLGRAPAAGASSALSALREYALRSCFTSSSLRRPSAVNCGRVDAHRVAEQVRRLAARTASASTAVLLSRPSTARPMRNFCSRALNLRTTSWPTHTRQRLGGLQRHQPAAGLVDLELLHAEHLRHRAHGLEHRVVRLEPVRLAVDAQHLELRRVELAELIAHGAQHLQQRRRARAGCMQHASTSGGLEPLLRLLRQPALAPRCRRRPPPRWPARRNCSTAGGAEGLVVLPQALPQPEERVQALHARRAPGASSCRCSSIASGPRRRRACTGPPAPRGPGTFGGVLLASTCR